MNPVKMADELLYPSKIVCVGRNYMGHIRELGNHVPDEPVIFLKPNSAISKRLHCDGQSIHYEGEMSFVIRQGKLAAVGFGLDLTRRDVQTRLKSAGLPWERSKAFDGAAVFSEFVAIDDDPSGLRIELCINEKLVQQGGCELMLSPPETLLEEVVRFMTLVDGDVLMSGTPEGVGPVTRGDRFKGRVYRGDELLVEGCWTAEEIHSATGESKS